MFKVTVPATSANIGPGFDTLGLALNLYNTFTFEEIPEGLEIIGCEEAHKNSDHLVYTSMVKTFEKIGYRAKGVRIGIQADIPISRGLGSSATCIIGGVMGAYQLAGRSFSPEEILRIATEIEGHADNIAPALYGGMTVSLAEKSKIYSCKIPVAKGMKLVALIPDFTLSTAEAREILPSTVSYKDAVFNLSRVSMLLAALSSGQFDQLEYALQDVLHQPYRGKIIPYFEELFQKNKELGAFGSYLSGAGPTIIAMIPAQDSKFPLAIKQHMQSLDLSWEVKTLELDLMGATVEKITKELRN